MFLVNFPCNSISSLLISSEITLHCVQLSKHCTIPNFQFFTLRFYHLVSDSPMLLHPSLRPTYKSYHPVFFPRSLTSSLLPVNSPILKLHSCLSQFPIPWSCPLTCEINFFIVLYWSSPGYIMIIEQNTKCWRNPTDQAAPVDGTDR